MDNKNEKRFLELKQALLKKEFQRMNDRQLEAVFHVEGPLLILAGAGSGKTTVIVNRIVNMVRYGNGYYSCNIPAGLAEADIQFMEGCLSGKAEDPARLRQLLAGLTVRPWNILAITFTNKAAGELKERLAVALGEDAKEVQASTFHSACVRILRRDIERLGYTRNFTIYDTDDCLRVIKDCLKTLNVDEKLFAPRAVLAAVSRAKDSLIPPALLLGQAGDDYRMITTAKLYDLYQKALKSANAVDFDDLINLTVQLFQDNRDVLAYYQNRYRYILVDEYQDTNHAQYMLVSLLAKDHHNICVVGDDDQSIYKFRGATIENIMSFEKQFPDTVVIRLEQNYRCTQNILDAANSVIENNTERKGKTLWTENEKGSPVHIFRTYDEQGEANFIADKIMDHVKDGGKFGDHAVLYRMNAQSNAIEKCFLKHSIPYKIVGGLKFYERKEIKDIVAYLSVVNNPADNLRLRRIINEPKRGIGDSTISAAQDIAENMGIAMYDVIADAQNYPILAKKSKALVEFTSIMTELIEMSEALPLDGFFDLLLERTGYLKYLELQGSEGKMRVENVQELKSNIIHYLASNEEATLAGFLEEIALYTDLDQLDAQNDYVILMTMHSAKGLEFPNVFIAGMEDGIFPNRQSLQVETELEEERRLAYVGITRAKQALFMTNAAQRMIFGQTIRNKVSRFIDEIPAELKEMEDQTAMTSRMQKATDSLLLKRKAMIQTGKSIGIAGTPTENAAPKVKADLKVGDRVRHNVFGEGKIISAAPMANDLLVEIAFDKGGTKKIMANFAKLEKIE